MVEQLLVKGGPTAERDRVIIFEMHGAHPNGEVFLADGHVGRVAMTPRVSEYLQSGRLERATEAEFEAFQSQQARIAEEGAIELARREEEALAAEMAQSEARFKQLKAENAARRQELAAQAGSKR